VTRRHPRERDAEAARRNQELAARLGAEIRRSRRLRRWSQRELGRRVGIAQSTVSRVECGRGASITLDLWQRLALTIDRDLRVDLGADPSTRLADAGHLAIQELVLRLGRAAGFRGSFELATRSTDPMRSVDVGLRDDRRRLVVLVECWNTFGDLGVAARATSRKLAEARDLAIAISAGPPHRVAGCWVVRSTRRNRALVDRYPEVFAARFPGSSLAWARTLAIGTPPPTDPGLVWSDLDATRIFAWRQRR